MLAVHRFGSGPHIVTLHGFTFTGEQFASAGRRLGRTAISPDLPGHGASRYASTSIADVVEAVAVVVDSVGSGVPVMGYSQGGRIALMCGIDHPDKIPALVLVSATAGIEDPVLREERASADRRMATRLRQSGLDDFLDSWTTTGITSISHRTAAEIRDDRRMRIQNTSEGLADAVTGYGQGSQPSLWNRLDELVMPVLVISGSLDAKYTQIGEAMAERMPDAEHLTIEGSGHNPFIDAPDAVYGGVSDFLDRRG